MRMLCACAARSQVPTRDCESGSVHPPVCVSLGASVVLARLSVPKGQVTGDRVRDGIT